MFPQLATARGNPGLFRMSFSREVAYYTYFILLYFADLRLNALRFEFGK